MDSKSVLHLTHLSRLQLDAEELQRAEVQLTRLLAYFDQLRGVDTTGIEPSPYPIVIENRERPDTPGPCLTTDQVLANAPALRSGQFVVPKVVDG